MYFSTQWINIVIIKQKATCSLQVKSAPVCLKLSNYILYKKNQKQWRWSFSHFQAVLKKKDINSCLTGFAVCLFKHMSINTFTAIVDLSRFNNSCLKSPASTLVYLTFQSRALRSFSLNQLRNLSL